MHYYYPWKWPVLYYYLNVFNIDYNNKIKIYNKLIFDNVINNDNYCILLIKEIYNKGFSKYDLDFKIYFNSKGHQYLYDDGNITETQWDIFIESKPLLSIYSKSDRKSISSLSNTSTFSLSSS